tara:strand:+ start:2402 stop:2596 length:195 start_codon:yes stop_codon:yes gene_type:complete
VGLVMVQVVSGLASVVSVWVVSGRVVSGRVAGWVVSEVSVEDRECGARMVGCLVRSSPRVNLGS